MATLGFDNRPPGTINSSLLFTASVAVDLGDLCYLDASTGLVLPASSLADQGSEAASQRLFASRYAGVAARPQSASDATGRPAHLAVDVEITNFTCESNTFVIGDYLAPVYSGGTLDPDLLVKTTDPTRAIARVTKAYTAATTTVQARFTSSLLSGTVVDSAGKATVAAPGATSVSAAGTALSYTGGAGYATTASTASAGGAAGWTGGAGGTATTGTAGAGGAAPVAGGAGGAASGAAGTGGVGGLASLIGGVGGAASDTAATAAGVGGVALVRSGAGGASSTTAVAGGAAGATQITGGAGGAGAAAGTGGAGSTIAIAAGAGGATSGAGTGGAGGSVTIAGGAGGTTSGGAAGARGLVVATGLVSKAGTTAVAISSATTLTQADSGGIFTVAQSSTYDIDLPSPTTGPGLRFFFSLTGPASFAPTITVAGGAATFVGSVVTEGKIVVATGATLTFASGVAVIGDSIEIRSIATNLYHVMAVSSIQDGITIA